MALRRKHLDLRRQGSFTKLQRLPFVADEWFRTSETLHDDIEDFAVRHCMAAPSFAIEIDATAQELNVDSADNEHAHALTSSTSHLQQPVGGPGMNGEQLEHEVFRLHKLFVVDVVDRGLAEFREMHHVSESEFEAVMQLSQEEEVREGKNFFRWTDVVSMTTFLVLMRAAFKYYHKRLADSTVPGSRLPSRPATQALLYHIECRSIEARNQHRRRTLLRPLLNKWCPESFQAILNLIASSANEFPPQLDVLRRKNLARWRIKLSTPLLGQDGVYASKSRDEEEWLLYLEKYCERMPDGTFEAFVAFAETYLAGEEEGEELKDRRASWLCFQQLDPLHTGSVYLEDLIDELTRFKGLFVSEVQREKFLRRLRLKLAGEDRTNRSASNLSLEVRLQQLEKANEAVEARRTEDVDSNISSASAVSGGSRKSGCGSSTPPVSPEHRPQSTPTPTSKKLQGANTSILLNLSQFQKCIEYVYTNCGNSNFRETVCRSFRVFVVALHKLIAGHEEQHLILPTDAGNSGAAHTGATKRIL